jgi:hypothetical protein
MTDARVVTGVAPGEAVIRVDADGARDWARVSTMARYRAFSLDFSPFVDGQNPHAGAVVTEAQVRADCFSRGRIRPGCANDLERIGRTARGLEPEFACGGVDRAT